MNRACFRVSRLAIVLVMAGVAATRATDFSEWTRRCQIQFGGYSRSEALTNFPVLVVLSPATVVGFSYADALTGGADLRFADETQTNELNYEIEQWNTNGTSYLWVQVPRLTNNACVWAYWGRSGQTAPGYTLNGATWSNGYVAVWHLNDSGATNRDSAGFNNALTNNGAVYTNAALAGGGMAFRGGTSAMGTPDQGELDGMGAALTLEGWGYRTSAVMPNAMAVISKRTDSATAYSYGLYVANADQCLYGDVNGPNSGQRLNSTVATAPNRWQHLAMAFNGTNPRRFYIDGQDAGVVGTEGQTTISNTASALVIGQLGGNLTTSWQGVLDEIRVSSVARSSNWLWACWRSTVSNSTFATYLNPDMPSVSTLPASNVTDTSACLGGSLGSTGSCATTVFVYWGPTDGGSSIGAWSNVCVFPAPQAVGVFSTNVASLMTPGRYYYRYAASNNMGFAWAPLPSQSLLTGWPGGGFYGDRFVATNGVGDGSNWANATNDIHSIMQTAPAGCTVWVSNGVYTLTNQLTITNFTVKSYHDGVLDRAGTIINGNNYAGKPVTNRCLYLNHAGAVVEGLTITNGVAAGANGGGVYVNAGTLKNCLVTGNFMTNGSGGGAYATGASSLITNCDFVANVAYGPGAGAFITTSARLAGSRLRHNRTTRAPGGDGAGANVAAGALMLNCEVISNTTATAGPGDIGAGVTVSAATIRNCLIVGNSGSYCGGGVGAYANGIIESCTIAGNSSGSGAGIGTGYNEQTIHIRNTISRDAVRSSYDLSSLFITNCCLVSTNIIGASGAGNTAVAPAFVNQAGGDYHQQPWSSGVDTGLWQSWMTNAVDLDGQPRVSANNLPDMGVYETTAALPADLYVAHGGQTPVFPYSNWVTAASNLQDVINVGFDGVTVFVSNGVYVLTNQIATGNSTFRSFNNGSLDCGGTIINGGFPTTTNRCVYLNGSGALLGFTITNGFAAGINGGGIYMTGGTVSNCVVTGHAATNGSGAGIYMTAGTVRDCVVSGNTVTNGSGAGIYMTAGTLIRCTITGNRIANGTGAGGGGIYANGAACLVTNCNIEANAAYGPGAGIYMGTSGRLADSRIRKNQAMKAPGADGAGVFVDNSATMWNCEIISNTTVSASPGNMGAGVALNGTTIRSCLIVANTGSYCGGGVAGDPGGTIENCTIVGNGSASGAGIGSSYGAQVIQVRNTVCPDGVKGSYDTATFYLTNCCLATTNIVGASGSGNITTAPSFVNAAAGDYRLQPWSPGVDAGYWLAWMTNAVDLLGQPRLSANNLPDMGAYETTAASPADLYVAHAGQTPVHPYTNWFTAASNLEDAIDVGYDGVTVFVSNGVYTLTRQINAGNCTFTSFRDGAQDRDGTIVDGGYPNNTNRCFVVGVSGALLGFTITNGFALGGNGGGISLGGGTVSNCTVTGNTASNGQGGGVYMSAGIVRNCTVTGNVVRSGGGGGVYSTAGTLRECLMTCNTATNGNGGGIYATGANTLITNCDLVANVAYGSGAGCYLASSARLVGSRIRNSEIRKVLSFGAGVYVGDGTVLWNCEIVSNVQATSEGSTQYGGGVWIDYLSATVRNCLIVRNTGYIGGGVGINSAGTQGGIVDSCTIAGNIGTMGAGIGMVGLDTGKAHIRNTICRDGVGLWYGQPNYSAPSFYVTNSCLTATNVANGTNNTWSASITNDPRFADAAAGDFRLKGHSPCVDAGFNEVWMTGAVDLDGSARISPWVNGTVDMGAYEYPSQRGTSFTLR